jgi:regulatory protein
MKSPFSRHIRVPTPESLAKAALNYLGRYAASEASLRRILENRLRRAALHDQTFAANKDVQRHLQNSIENIIERYRKSGALNDAAYAEMKVHSLRRAGRSARAIHQKLGHAGVGKEMIESALAGPEDESDPEGAEIKAAVGLARRRRLGPFRPGRGNPTLYRKDLAALARAGFSFDVARQVLGDQGLGDDADVADGGGADEAGTDTEGFSAK